MRYKEGEEGLRLANHASDDMFIGTSIYGFILGLGFIFAGLKVKQRWLTFWGAALSLASVASWFAMMQ
ncbi:MAG: hypothetical protein GXP13_02490 [Gammaproteobacteria bacterium]|nr:hypothetical protein [Gammaproteobacteria bacterium]